MSTGRDRVAARVRDPETTLDQPAQEPMRAGARGAAGGAVARNPSTDQRRMRRQMARARQEPPAPATTRTAFRGDASMSNQYEAGLIQLMAAAPTRAEQERIAAQLAAYRADRTAQAREARSLDFATQAVEVLYPSAPPLSPTTSSRESDWLGDVTAAGAVDLGEVTQQMTAQAALWYRDVPPMVLSDPEEFRIQAHGMARRCASGYGLDAPAGQRAFLDHVGHLYGRRVHAEQVQPGSELPVGVTNEETFDTPMFAPAGPPNRETEPTDSPSLAEGDAPEGDTSEQITNPAAWDSHDAANPNTTATDYLDGVQTPAQYGTGLQTMNSLSDHTPLLVRAARQVLSEGVGMGGEQSGVVDQPRGSSDMDQLTPSQQEGDEPEGDVAMTGQPPVELRPHDAGPGNGPATDALDGVQYAWGTGAATGQLRPLAVIARSIPQTALAAMPREALTFATALLRLRTASDRLGQVDGRVIVEAFLRTHAGVLPATIDAELRAHLDPRVAGDLPPWLKKDGDDEDSDEDSDSGDSDKDSDEDDDSDDSSSDSSDESDSDDDSDDSKDDADDEDSDSEKKTSAFRQRVQAELSRRLSSGNSRSTVAGTSPYRQEAKVAGPLHDQRMINGETVDVPTGARLQRQNETECEYCGQPGHDYRAHPEAIRENDRRDWQTGLDYGATNSHHY